MKKFIASIALLWPVVTFAQAPESFGQMYHLDNQILSQDGHLIECQPGTGCAANYWTAADAVATCLNTVDVPTDQDGITATAELMTRIRKAGKQVILVPLEVQRLKVCMQHSKFPLDVKVSVLNALGHGEALVTEDKK